MPATTGVIATGVCPSVAMQPRLLTGAALVLFFVLSAFLLYRSWVRAALDGTAPPALGGYARRRLARIVLAGLGLQIAIAGVMLVNFSPAPFTGAFIFVFFVTCF